MLTSTSAALKVRIEELLFTLQLLQALELNQDGFSPIHITAINGDIELVRALLKIDSSLCSLKDRDGRTPIHLAAVKGRLDVMVELLSTCPELAREVTVQGETIFHLVVKSNQFEAFKVLLEKVGFHYLLNFKDQDGNTILHLAVCRKQIQTVELLLNSKSERMVEVNAKNLNNLTAMDQSSCDEGYFIIGWLLLRAIEQCAKSQETIEVTISHDQMERANSVTG
ncbi:hypothetical protein Scep_026503 [Stephania cephalantha]|uniref:Ankyrin repeat-containing protein BDA1-like n=1 Tax=Stephania cephalantha TaxID=152367 RepID=A0AAP0EU52_9MAGN